MIRRRDVQASGARFEVIDAECVGIQVTVPADHVELVVVDEMAGDLLADLHLHLELAFSGVVMRLQQLGFPEIALPELPVLVAVTLGRVNLAIGLEHQQPPAVTV